MYGKSVQKKIFSKYCKWKQEVNIIDLYTSLKWKPANFLMENILLVEEKNDRTRSEPGIGQNCQVQV
jgi:hypothetical protein